MFYRGAATVRESVGPKLEQDQSQEGTIYLYKKFTLHVHIHSYIHTLISNNDK